MALRLEGWAGDNAGKIVGRQPNRLIISASFDYRSYPSSLFHRSNLFGLPWYSRVNITCLTHRARFAIATTVESVGFIASHAWAIELAEVDWLDNRDPWTPGIHLFTVMLQEPGGQLISTMATALIDDSVKRIAYQPDETPPIDWMISLMQAPQGQP